MTCHTLIRPGKPLDNSMKIAKLIIIITSWIELSLFECSCAFMEKLMKSLAKSIILSVPTWCP